MKNVKVWNEFKTGADGRLYGVRYMLDNEELAGLQAAGLVGDASEIIGMKEYADHVLADFELQSYKSAGGAVQ